MLFGQGVTYIKGKLSFLVIEEANLHANQGDEIPVNIERNDRVSC